MRILFHSEAGLGHLFPLLPFARAARAAGDDFLFALPVEAVPTVEAFGYRAWAQLPEHDVNTYVVADIFVRIQAAAALPALQAAIRTHAADGHHHRARRHRRCRAERACRTLWSGSPPSTCPTWTWPA
jgi:UDP:flavonoid glycosyltransferase YjiC (YdhE family)